MTRPNQPLHSQTALVTGASTGIGRAIALELATAGASVMIHARANRDAAAAVRDEVDRLGQPCRVELADFDDANAIDRLAERAWQWRDGLDILVNNAGADTLTGENAAESFDRKLERLWQIDVSGTMRLARGLGRRMKAAGKGVILNIGWDGADRGMAGDSGELFAASKGAVMAFTRSLAHSLAPEVRVNCLAPGWILTAWGRQASDEWQERARSESLSGRWGTPEDVARAARFLVSLDAAFINAQVIAVNGGWNHG
jgi:3-oxoacyl-[acyl-carrier protein] reductase